MNNWLAFVCVCDVCHCWAMIPSPFRKSHYWVVIHKHFLTIKSESYNEPGKGFVASSTLIYAMDTMTCTNQVNEPDHPVPLVSHWKHGLLKTNVNLDLQHVQRGLINFIKTIPQIVNIISYWAKLRLTEHIHTPIVFLIDSVACWLYWAIKLSLACCCCCSAVFNKVPRSNLCHGEKTHHIMTIFQKINKQ